MRSVIYKMRSIIVFLSIVFITAFVTYFAKPYFKFSGNWFLINLVFISSYWIFLSGSYKSKKLVYIIGALTNCINTVICFELSKEYGFFFSIFTWMFLFGFVTSALVYVEKK